MDNRSSGGHNPAMRAIVAVALLAALTGCSGSPHSMGITGPGVAPPPAVPAPDDPENTGTLLGGPGSSGTYHPETGPTTGGGRFWGYN
jgi:hypothetical protein